jgi:hypothetical protein
VTANPSKVITIHDLASLANAACQASFTAKNITSAFAEPGVRPFSRVAFSDEDFEASLFVFTDKELAKQEISVPSASTSVAREISGTGKDSLPPEDVRPFPESGP